MKFNNETLFKLILVVVGGFIIFAGINVGFGGIRSLGWQVPSDFLTVTNEANFTIQDNHVRFLGGAFGVVGIFLLLAVSDLNKYQTALRLVFVLMFVGGLSRLTSPQPNVVLDGSVITSFLAEIILAPILFFWLGRLMAQEER